MPKDTSATPGPEPADTRSWPPPTQPDRTIAHPARMYDYYLGGNDNFEVDRQAAEAAIAAYPALPATIRANRAFLGRAVTYAARQGIRQFLDIGTGLPTAGSTGDVTQRVAPDAHVVYVDNDPIVLAHARTLLARHHAGRARMIQADLRDPGSILTDPAVEQCLDLTQPVALILVAVLHFIENNAGQIVGRLRDVLAPGSLLVISHATADFMPPPAAETTTQIYSRASAPMILRERAEVQKFFGDFELIDPGLVQLPLWRPDNGKPVNGWQELSGYAGVAIKP